MNPRGMILLIGAALAGLVLFTAGLRAMPSRERPLPVIATVPEFTLISDRDLPVSRKDLLGAPWVVDLMFTSCAGICPRMTAELSRVEKASRDVPEVRFVSISVDPDRDTPEALAAYREKMGIETDRWYFLTGTQDEIFELASSGLLLPAKEGDPSIGQEDVLHSSRFVLIDGQARIRGMYDSRDPEAIQRLQTDLRRVDETPAS